MTEEKDPQHECDEQDSTESEPHGDPQPDSDNGEQPPTNPGDVPGPGKGP